MDVVCQKNPICLEFKFTQKPKTPARTWTERGEPRRRGAKYGSREHKVLMESRKQPAQTKRNPVFFFSFLSCSWLVILRSPLDKLAVLIRRKINYCLRPRRWEFQLLQFSFRLRQLDRKNMNTALWPANILVMNLNSTNLSWGSAVETDAAVVKPPFWPASCVYLLYAIHVWWWWNIFHVKKYTENRENHWNLDRSDLLSTAAAAHNVLRFNLQNWTNNESPIGENISSILYKWSFWKTFFKKRRPLFPALGYFFLWCSSPPLTQVLLTFHEHLFGAICALHCGASVSVNSALQHHLVCTLTFWSALNFGTPSAATYGGGGGISMRSATNIQHERL